jgi:ATP-dependent Clp protease ATP-binding subunit ClpA
MGHGWERKGLWVWGKVLEAAVKLSHTYIADRFLPDKVHRE